MVPTMEGYFGEWKSSRFIVGGNSKEKAFVAHSRLIDVHGILLSLRNIYSGVKPLVARSSIAQSDQIGSQLNALSSFVDSIYAKETAGKQFKPNEADLLGIAGAEAGERDRGSGQPGRGRTRDQAPGLDRKCERPT